MIRVDLHTHSEESPDGGLDESDYKKALFVDNLDVIAITDHNTIAFAQYLKSKPAFASSIIVGEEISTTDGDMIGLFLDKVIPAGLSAQAAAQAIRAQEGFVLVPHPADPNRKGLSFSCMDSIADLIDGVEVLNGRIIGANSPKIRTWASTNSVPHVAASDAHSYSGIGKTFTSLPSMPQNAEELRLLLNDTTELHYKRPPLRAFLAPKLNRLLKLLSQAR